MTAQPDRALATLKASDRKLARLIDATKPIDPTAWRRARPLGDPFSVLVYSIIGQQISGYAARAIAGRLEEQFAGRMPSPAELLAMDPATLKSVGLSQRKVEYVRSLAEHIISGELQIDRLHKLSDDAVREQIVASRGLGRWTADMFLLVNLQRPDILPIGDLGIRSAVQRLYRLDHLPSPREVDAIGEKWRPNRSLASFYLWASRPTVASPTVTNRSQVLRKDITRRTMMATTSTAKPELSDEKSKTPATMIATLAGRTQTEAQQQAQG